MKEKAKGIDPTRHLLQFDPHVFADRRVDVIGCGAVGARIAMELGCFGIANLHLWDGDRIESHNVANQRPYVQADLGKMKVEALADHLEAATLRRPHIHPQYLRHPAELGNVVFLAVDTMAARKQIFDQSLHLKFDTQYVIEVRMGVDELRVYGLNPRERHQVALWRASLSDDKDTKESVCQTQTTVGDAASITAGLAVARFRHWYRREIARDPAYAAELQVEQILMLRPLLAITN